VPSFPVEPLRDAGPRAAGDPAALRRRAARDGHLFFRGALDEGLVLCLRHEVLVRCAERGWLDPAFPVDAGRCVPWARLAAYDDERWIGLQQEVFVLPELVALRREPFVLAVLERLFGEPPLDQQGDTCRIVSPAARDLTTPPHQDRFYLERSDRLWTVWIPLGDCPLELGGLAVLRGSHRNGLFLQGPSGAEVDPEAAWATTDYRAGDVLMFSCLTLHRAAENETENRLRVSVDFRYVPESA
jgi:Phytanoyl-CoA dioxygenase (PhyH)